MQKKEKATKPLKYLQVRQLLIVIDGFESDNN